MKLIVGLGNPGPEYKYTRHNIGFRTVDTLCKKLKVPKFKKYNKSLLARKKEWLFLKPHTYMNLSGQAVKSLTDEFEIEKNDLFVIVDDVYIPLGEIRIRQRGSDGGHNGLKSIIDSVGTDNFPRMRIGILPHHYEDAGKLPMPLEEFVLMTHDDEEEGLVDKVISQAVELTSYFLFQNFEKMSAAYSRLCSLSVE